MDTEGVRGVRQEVLGDALQMAWGVTFSEGWWWLDYSWALTLREQLAQVTHTEQP